MTVGSVEDVHGIVASVAANAVTMNVRELYRIVIGICGCGDVAIHL